MISTKSMIRYGSISIVDVLFLVLVPLAQQYRLGETKKINRFSSPPASKKSCCLIFFCNFEFGEFHILYIKIFTSFGFEKLIGKGSMRHLLLQLQIHTRTYIHKHTHTYTHTHTHTHTNTHTDLKG